MIRKDIDNFLASLPNDITLVAATKYGDKNDILDLFNHGVKNFGENRVDAFLAKYEELKDNKEIKWHFIGHLQRNKAKLVINKIDYLHSLDSLELAKMIDQLREKPLDTFIEVSINLEENKNGVPYYEVEQFINNLKQFHNVHIVGLMMMAIKGSNDTTTQFKKLRLLRDELETKCNIKLPYLSMGMTDDYQEAILEGATHIRLGRILFDLN
ncbi:MAG: YggS family pyridoxal phosphate-dependent enzyme [Erysipelotrichaceae bacterium]|nr:YggS family pyridoxal phosphate-dependent enzyme [Erysipelotrichaceae bacterium]